MDLTKKPLYALRDLAARMGIHAPTGLVKADLIAQIEECKTQMENGFVPCDYSNLGRPRLNPCFIDFKQDENGKITFYEIENQYPYENTKTQPDSAPVPRQPIIKDENTRQKLLDALDLLQTLSFAINKVLEND